MSPRIPALAVVALLGLAQAAPAQENVTRSGTVESGKSVRIGTVSALKQDCTVGQVGSIRIVTAPKHGSVTIRSGKSKTSATFRCPNVETPIQGVFYQSNPSYQGADELVYEVKTQEGRTVVQTIKINVQNKPGAGGGGGVVDL